MISGSIKDERAEEDGFDQGNILLSTRNDTYYHREYPKSDSRRQKQHFVRQKAARWQLWRCNSAGIVVIVRGSGLRPVAIEVRANDEAIEAKNGNSSR